MLNEADRGSIRPLFIEELTEVRGGGPVEDLLDMMAIDDWLIKNTTQACCEEGPDNCC
jgi:hypothetical protein